MSHNHSHDTTGNLRVAFFLNLGFTILEIAGGIWTNSLAILSDAVHDLGDSFSLGVAWYLDRYSQKRSDMRFSYGYRRYSLLGALISTAVLLVGSFYVLSEAIPRLFAPEHSNAQGMVVFAIIGIAVNGFAALRLRGGRSLNARVVALHLLEDVLGWVAILVVSIILLFADIHILDPILSILITLYVLYNVLGNLRTTARLFLQAVPDEIDLKLIEDRIEALDKVRSQHHTHVWSLDGEHHVLTTHIVVDENSSREEVQHIKEAVHQLSKEFDFVHTTIEVEFENEPCGMEMDEPIKAGSL